MKNQTKVTLIALAIAGIATASQAASYPNTDLIIGFTAQSGNDFEFDLGTAGSLTSGETWNLSSSLGGLNSSTVKWGVVGSDNINEIAYVTKATGLPGTLTETHWGNTDNAVNALYSVFTTAGAGSSVAPAATLANSWNQQTIAGALTTQYHNAYINPNGTGYSSLSLYSIVADGSPASLLGTFSFANDGIVTFNSATPVPEPATYGMFAGAGLLALSLRKQLRRKQA